MNYRPSAAPGFAICPSFVEEPLLRHAGGGVAASVGTAAHDLFAEHIVPGAEINAAVIRAVGEKHGVQLDGYTGLKRKVAGLKAAWDEKAARYFPNPEREKLMSYTLPNLQVLKGTADLFQAHEKFFVILDLKTGESERLDYMWQLKDYCLIAYRNYGAEIACEPGAPIAYAFVFNPVLDQYEVRGFTAEQLEQHERYLVDRMEKVGKEYCPGSACAWCPMLATCPMLREQAKNIAVVSGLDLTSATAAETIRKIRPLLPQLRKALEDYDTFETAALKATGTVDMGDGTELYLDTIERIVDIDVDKAVLQIRSLDPKRATEEMARKIARTTKQAVNEVIADLAPPRGKTKFLAQFWADFENVDGGFRYEISQKRAIRKTTAEMVLLDPAQEGAAASIGEF